MSRWEFQGYDPEYEAEAEAEAELARRNEHAKDIEMANKAVKLALAAFARQKWYETAIAKARFALFWATYWFRLQLFRVIVGVFRTDAKKTYFRLGL